MNNEKESYKTSGTASFNLTEKARLPRSKRKPRQSSLEFEAKVDELSKAGYSPIQIGKETGKSKQAVYYVLQKKLAYGELRPDQTSYQRAGPPEERRWYKVVERTAQELDFYSTQGLVPTARKMYYRLIELTDENGNPILTKSKTEYDRFCRVTAEARKGVDSTYSRETSLPRLPIDCFVDEKRVLLGDTDIDKTPRQPEPDQWPDDWEGYLQNEIDEVRYAVSGLDDIPDNYDGRVRKGLSRLKPGKSYKQPIYREIWCESATIQPDINMWFGNQVHVCAAGGFISTPYFSRNCKRLADIVSTHDHIEKIVILYLQDYDKAGDDIAGNLANGFDYYCGNLHIQPDDPDFIIGVEVEFRPIAITEEQIEEYGLIENPEKKYNVQLEAFITTEKKIEAFKQIIQDALDDCWDEGVYNENCPPEEYDYAAHNEEKPEDYDIDNDLPDPEEYILTAEEQEMENTREIMEHRIELFKQELRDELS